MKEWKCPKCNHNSHIPIVAENLPITCECGYTTKKEFIVTKIIQTPINLWIIIHQYLAQQTTNNSWNKQEAIEYYESYWYPMIPECCREHFELLVTEFGIDWTTAQTAFYSFWQLHNEVSIRYANKTPITYAQAEVLYFGPQTTTTINGSTIHPQKISLEAGNNPGVGD